MHLFGIEEQDNNTENITEITRLFINNVLIDVLKNFDIIIFRHYRYFILGFSDAQLERNPNLTCGNLKL